MISVFEIRGVNCILGSQLLNSEVHSQIEMKKKKLLKLLQIVIQNMNIKVFTVYLCMENIFVYHICFGVTNLWSYHKTTASGQTENVGLATLFRTRS